MLKRVFFLDDRIAFYISNRYPQGILSNFPHLNSILTEIFSFITHLGEFPYILTVALLLFFYARWKKNKRLEYLIKGIFFTMILAGVVIIPLKSFFMRSRPFVSWNSSQFYFITSVFQSKIPFTVNYMSFPSGHTIMAFSIYSFLGFNSTKIFSKIFWFSFASLIAFSRLYLSFHWFSDIMVGALIGTCIGEYMTIKMKKY